MEGTPIHEAKGNHMNPSYEPHKSSNLSTPNVPPEKKLKSHRDKASGYRSQSQGSLPHEAGQGPHHHHQLPQPCSRDRIQGPPTSSMLGYGI